MVVSGLTFLYPMLWMLIMSLKEKNEIFDNPFGLPKAVDFLNYTEVLKKGEFLVWFGNSLIYCVATIALTLVLSSMFAYGVSRMRFRFGKAAMTYVSLGLVIPVQISIIPLYIILQKLHLRETYFGLILPYAAFSLASATLMLYAFFRTLPFELEEAACLDGCNVYTCFIKIILPMVKPALSTQVALIFMNTWNEFFLAYILSTRKNMPLTVAFLDFLVGIGTNDWGIITAAMLISSIPVIIVYLIFSDKIEQALTAGAILK